MQYLMAIPPNQNIPQHIVEFDPALPSWRKNPAQPGEVLAMVDDMGNQARAGHMAQLKRQMQFISTLEKGMT